MTWTPGHRRVPPGLKKIIGSHMMAIGQINGTTVRVFDNSGGAPLGTDIDDDSPTEVGPEIFLSFQRAQKKFGLNLSGMTTEELDALRTVVYHAFDQARPVVVERDRIAKEASERGDAIYYRSLRGTPKASIFTRPGGSNASGVHGGHQNAVAGGGSSGGDPASGAGGAGGDLDEQASPGSSAQDPGA